MDRSYGIWCNGGLSKTEIGKSDDPYNYDLTIRPSVKYFLVIQNEVPAEELPEDKAYTPEPEDRKEPVAIGECYSYPRDKKTALKALNRADYECEIDKDHPSFI